MAHERRRGHGAGPAGAPPRGRRPLLAAALASAGLCAVLCGPGTSAAAGDAVDPRLPLRRGASWEEVDDPRRDGWDSEAESARVQKQLESLARLVLHPEERSPERLRELASPSFSSRPLRPTRLRTVFQDRLFTVQRGETGEDATEPEGTEPPGPIREGPEGLGAVLAELSALLLSPGLLSPGLPGPGLPGAGSRLKFKLFDIQLEDGALSTRQYVEAVGLSETAVLEVNATWTSRFRRSAEGEGLLLERIGVEAWEECRRPVPRPLLADCAQAVLGANPSWEAQLLRGFNHWLERIQDRRFFAVLGTPGLAVGDVDGDGLDDLYLTQEGGLPNRLFLQNADGTARDVSASSGADWLESSRGALLVDLDNDGRQDLALAVQGLLVLSAGDGTGRFAVRALLPTSHDTMSLSAADFDRDGDLDLHVAAYKRDDLLWESGVLTIDSSVDFLFHDANDGAPDFLFRNDTAPGAEWRFTDATREVGLDHNHRRYSFASAWEDFDRDGDLDLYVANDFGRNNLYRCDTSGGGVRFTDVAGELGAEDPAASMSVSWGDYDRDGWPDLYVGNMFSAAGGRVTSQPGFKPEAPGEVKDLLRRFARGNTLLRNVEGRGFRDVSEEAGVTMGRWAWSSNFADLNNDGWEDLVVANGYITTEDPGDL